MAQNCTENLKKSKTATSVVDMKPPVRQAYPLAVACNAIPSLQVHTERAREARWEITNKIVHRLTRVGWVVYTQDVLCAYCSAPAGKNM